MKKRILLIGGLTSLALIIQTNLPAASIGRTINIINRTPQTLKTYQISKQVESDALKPGETRTINQSWTGTDALSFVIISVDDDDHFRGLKIISVDKITQNIASAPVTLSFSIKPEDLIR